MFFENPVHPVVEDVALGSRQLLGRYPQRFLSPPFPSHAHIAFSWKPMFEPARAVMSLPHEWYHALSLERESIEVQPIPEKS